MLAGSVIALIVEACMTLVYHSTIVHKFKGITLHYPNIP